MSKIIKFQTEKDKNIERLNMLSRLQKIILFGGEVRIPKGTFPSGMQQQVGKALTEADGDIVKTERILREKGFLKRKSPCYERLILKDCHICKTNILHPEVKKMEEAYCIKWGISTSIRIENDN